MRIDKVVLVSGIVALLSTAFSLSPMKAIAEMNGDGGGHSVNLTVQQVTIQPVRAYIGDPIDVDVVIDNREDGSETSWVEVYANKKKVGSQMFRWGTPGADRTSRVTVRWDTSRMAPGEYKVKAEAFVFQDTSPFDNDLTLKQPVILVAPGGQFPGGLPAGGSVTETDTRYK